MTEERKPRIRPAASKGIRRRTEKTDVDEEYSKTATAYRLPQHWTGSTPSLVTVTTATSKIMFPISSTGNESHRESPRRNSILSSTGACGTRNYDQPPAYSDIFSKSSATKTIANNGPLVAVDDRISTQIRRDVKKVDTTDRHGLIILGNSGVGKSFLANILLGREAFVHEVRSSSVTHNTDFTEINFGDIVFAIFDIPGLIEADQRRVDLNKREIEKAFRQRPNSIIIYVFGNQNGRIRDEDVVAFKAIDAAYSFQREALVLVVNGLPRKRARDYEGTTLVLLQQLLPNIEINDANVCFLDTINPDSERRKQFLKEQLLQVVVKFTPMVHYKKQEIMTTSDRLQTEIRNIREQQAQFEVERHKYMKEIRRNQKLLDETISDHQSETESYQKALHRQEEMFLKQQREFVKERRQYQAQLDDLHKRTNQAHVNYQKHCRDDQATSEALRASQNAYKTLQNSLDRLTNRLSSQPPTKKHSSCVIS